MFIACVLFFTFAYELILFSVEFLKHYCVAKLCFKGSPMLKVSFISIHLENETKVEQRTTAALSGLFC